MAWPPAFSSVLVARAVRWGGPVILHLTVPPEDKEALGVIDEDPVAALTHRELAQVLSSALPRAASGAARVYRAGGGGGRLGGAQMAAQAQAAAAAQTAAATPTQTP